MSSDLTKLLPVLGFDLENELWKISNKSGKNR